LKTLFEIGTITSNDLSILFLEIGETYISLSVVDSSKKLLTAASVFTFNPTEIDRCVEEVTGELKGSEGFERVFISPAFPEALLVPTKLFQNEDLVKTVFQIRDGAFLKDNVGEWQMVNSYSIPLSVDTILHARFKDAVFIHAYTPSLRYVWNSALRRKTLS
jgi:hypothetical protein